MGVCYIAVHGGAGRHGKTSEPRVKDAMKRACIHALQLPSPSALALVERAIAILEDDDCLNAGYGSNLTIDGTVECDAALMDGKTGDFASVGAVAGVRHPIQLARAILEHARVPDKLGRIRPMTLVGTGAHAFARANGVDTVDPTDTISPRARQDWSTWLARHDRAKEDAHDGADATRMEDTVGAVAIDADGNVAAGVSSGGLLLKCSGRIGEAAAFGAGCWADQSRDGVGMACSISGAGEHIMRTGLARAIADAVGGGEVDMHEVLTSTLTTRFHDPIVARGGTPNAGVLLMNKEVDVMPRLWCAFTTESMALAYADSERMTPKAKILRRPKAPQPVLGTSASPIYITALPLHD